MKRLVLVFLMMSCYVADAVGSIAIDPESSNLLWAEKVEPPTDDAIYAAIKTDLELDLADLELYKSDYETGESGGVDSKLFANSYSTSFDTSTDPNNAEISWIVSQPYINILGPAYLLVKGGAQDPSAYLFDITGWNGTDEISLIGFWQDTNGAISHVTILGVNSGVPELDVNSEVPEPASLAIWALIAAGGAAAARKRRGRWSKGNREAILEIIQKN